MAVNHTDIKKRKKRDLFCAKRRGKRTIDR